MRTHTYRAAAALAATGLLGTPGCFLFDQEGRKSLGMVSVEAVLVQDSCGPGAGVRNPSTTFAVEILVTDTTLTWVAQGGTSQGNLQDGAFCIETGRSWHVRDPDPWLEDPGCDMLAIERLCGHLELGEGETGELDRLTRLSARHELYAGAQAGSYCPELIGLQQGQFLALPCQVVFELTGSAVSN